MWLLKVIRDEFILINSILWWMYSTDMGDAADVSKIHAVSIFRFEDWRGI